MDTFAGPEIPEVDDTVPASRDEGAVVDEFQGKYSVIVALVVPAGGQEVMRDCLGFWVES